MVVCQLSPGLVAAEGLRGKRKSWWFEINRYAWIGSLKKVLLKFVSAVGSEEEFDLKPDRMFGPDEFAVIVVILEADFGKFAGIESQDRSDTRALTAIDIAGVVSAVITIGVFAAQADHPTGMESPKDLGVEAPIAENFGR